MSLAVDGRAMSDTSSPIEPATRSRLPPPLPARRAPAMSPAQPTPEPSHLPQVRTAMAFRSDINGLRAVAVALVVLYHLGVPGFHGGYPRDALRSPGSAWR